MIQPVRQIERTINLTSRKKKVSEKKRTFRKYLSRFQEEKRDHHKQQSHFVYFPDVWLNRETKKEWENHGNVVYMSPHEDEKGKVIDKKV